MQRDYLPVYLLSGGERGGFNKFGGKCQKLGVWTQKRAEVKVFLTHFSPVKHFWAEKPQNWGL